MINTKTKECEELASTLGKILPKGELYIKKMKDCFKVMYLLDTITMDTFKNMYIKAINETMGIDIEIQSDSPLVDKSVIIYIPFVGDKRDKNWFKMFKMLPKAKKYQAIFIFSAWFITTILTYTLLKIISQTLTT